MKVELWSSSFCGACASTRAVIEQAQWLVAGVTLSERNVALAPDAAELARIEATPTVIFSSDDGTEVFRSAGVPTIHQVLAGLALAAG
ncbi:MULTISPECIES: thioredoxin [Subtercola]|uniref:Thioredoxin n=1 Tax=Subtercola vilae TaxID=2056433 RepID=A0A4T2C5C9_9MICO|nr:MULTISPECIES: thioredoxin [Subtercola]MEA9985442.1 thioredoxin [Subtercola sp. RTI3]TIH39330.1 thioredoxin [Subtercola vilae]